MEHFFQKYCQFRFYANFTRKNVGQTQKIIIFQDFFVQNPQKIKSWQYFSKRNAPDFLPLCVEAMFQISAGLDSKCKCSSKITKTSENSILVSFCI